MYTQINISVASNKIFMAQIQDLKDPIKLDKMKLF